MLYFCSYEVTHNGNVINRGQTVIENSIIKSQADYNKVYERISKMAKTSLIRKSGYRESELFVHLISFNGLF